MLLVNFGVITADLVPPEWLQQKNGLFWYRTGLRSALVWRSFLQKERKRLKKNIFLPDISLAMSHTWRSVCLYRRSQPGG